VTNFARITLENVRELPVSNVLEIEAGDNLHYSIPWWRLCHWRSRRGTSAGVLQSPGIKSLSTKNTEYCPTTKRGRGRWLQRELGILASNKKLSNQLASLSVIVFFAQNNYE